MNIAGYDAAKTIKMLDEVVSRSVSKTKLLERISNGSVQKIALPTGETPAARKKRDFVAKLASKSIDTELTNDDLLCCLQTIRGLSAPEVSSNSLYLRGILRGWFNKHYSSAQGALADNIRRAICWIDEALYMDGINSDYPLIAKPLKVKRKSEAKIKG
jgi:hypothetical protein